jgi:radical SAM superfamily enzyme YgiQ (UPF0313 family)
MRILLIYPPKNSEVLVPVNFEPLALEILASTVTSDEVKLIDLRFEPTSILDKILTHDTPDVIGITTNNTIQVNLSKQILKYIKNYNSEIKTIIGGTHPTLAPYDFYTPYIDAIFVGWAEKSFPQYLDLIKSNKEINAISGIIQLKNGHPISPKNTFSKIEAEDIPIPNRNIASKYNKFYRNELGKKYALVNTARGCLFRCSFCACWKAANSRYLVRSATDVLQEIINLPSDVSNIFFADDNTFSDVSRAQELFRLIKKREIRKRYSAYCRTDTIVKHPELFRNWKEIGLDNLTIGFEAVDNKKLKDLNKNNEVETNQKAVQILNDLHINFASYFLIDPNFKKNDFEKVQNYVIHLNLIKPRFVILTPLPGTDLFEHQKENIKLSYDFFDFMHWVIPTRLKPIEFFNSFKRLYYKCYSYKRYFKAIAHNFFMKFKTMKSKGSRLDHLSLIELILLRVMAAPLKRKLYRQYFRSNILK